MAPDIEGTVEKIIFIEQNKHFIIIIALDMGIIGCLVQLIVIIINVFNFFSKYQAIVWSQKFPD